MLDVNKIFFGRIWTVNEYCGKGVFGISLTDKRYRVLYLTELQGKKVFEDLKTGTIYPLDIERIVYDKYFIYTKDLKTIYEVCPKLNTPYQISLEDALKIKLANNEDEVVEENQRVDMSLSLKRKRYG